MKDFRSLKVREKAHSLTLDVYKITSHFPKDELYGLTSQLRRCSASMGSTLPKAVEKKVIANCIAFCEIASGFASELDYHLLRSRDLNYLAEIDYQRVGKQLLEFRRMLTALLQKVGSDRFSADC